MKSNLINWVEYDYNPFVLFSNNGKVVYANKEAEHILSDQTIKEIYQIAISYAPLKPEYKTVFKSFKLDNIEFNSITVGYDNEEEIGIKLYYVIKNREKHIDLKHYESLNLYFILDFVRSYLFIDHEVSFINDYDPTIPDIKLAKEETIKLFSYVYSAFKTAKEIVTKVNIKFGERIKLNNKNYSMIEVKISGDSYTPLSKESESRILDVSFNSDFVTIHIPIII